MAFAWIYSFGRFLGDFVFLLLLAGNVAFQSFVLIKVVQTQTDLANQCSIVDIFTYGILANILSMFAILPISSVCLYSIKAKHYDPFGILIVLFNIAWLCFSGIGYISKLFACRRDSYTFVQGVIVLSINVTIGILVIYFGGKHGQQKHKRQRRFHSIERASDIDANRERRPALQSDPQSIPRLNKFLS